MTVRPPPPGPEAKAGKTRIDEALAALDRDPPGWNDLREQRLLAKIEHRIAAGGAQVSAPAEFEERMPSSRLWLAVGVLAAVLVAAITIAFAAGQGDGDDSVAELQSPPAAVKTSGPQIPDATLPVLALADGSMARMHSGAQVDVDVQTDDLVRVVQSSGLVRYEVTPNPARRFVVDAAGVEVRVIGTVFTVSIEAEHVEVAVVRGRVAVESAERVAELGAGDQLRVERQDGDEIVMVLDDPEPESSAVPDSTATKSRPATKPARSVSKSRASAEQLLARADEARGAGRLADAAAALSELVRRHPRDPRAYASYFALGKVERSRGHHAAAASAFSACFKRAPSGALSEDARAEAAASWGAAGQRVRAGKAASGYLDLFPEGAHAARMRRILEKSK